MPCHAGNTIPLARSLVNLIYRSHANQQRRQGRLLPFNKFGGVRIAGLIASERAGVEKATPDRQP